MRLFLFTLLLLAAAGTIAFPQNSIHEAVKTAKYDKITELLKAGCNIDSLDNMGFAPIHYAAAFADFKMIDFLFANHANIDQRDSRGMSALHMAAKSGDLETYQKLIAVGADWDLVYNAPFFDDKTTPKYCLNIAGEAGNQHIVDYINSEKFPKTGQVLITLVKHGGERMRLAVDEGFPVDERDSYGATALMYAPSMDNYVRWMKYLIDKGADPNKKDIYNRGIYHYVALKGAYEAVELMTELKLDIEAKDIWGQTPLMTAAWFSGATTIGNLLDAGANPNVTDAGGDAPLMAVLIKKNDENALEIIKKLIAKGANVNALGSDKIPPLCQAIVKGKPQCVDYLLDNGANVNYTDSDGWTPALQCVFKSDAQMAALMLQKILARKPDNLNAVYQGNTALSVAKSKDFDECVKLLEAAGAR